MKKKPAKKKTTNEKTVREAITPTEYRAFQKAYDHFNRELFAGTLPHVLVTLQRRARTLGYFSADRFKSRLEESRVSEIALNPDGFTGRTDEEILSTLGHEMVHTWQETHGAHPPKSRYHNKEWAAKMKEIGLYPSHTGEPGGKETGQRVSHYIIAGGPYAQVYAKLAATGFELRWQSSPVKKSRDESKVKFTCPQCLLNVWGKATAHVDCHVCSAREGKDVTMLGPEAFAKFTKAIIASDARFSTVRVNSASTGDDNGAPTEQQ